MRRLASLLLGVTLTGACAKPLPPPDPAFVAEWQKWHDGRIQRLTAEDGWLSLVGLPWLQPGDNRVDEVPGLYKRDGRNVLLVATVEDAITIDGQPVTERPLAADTSGKPDVLHHGSRQWFVVERGDRIGLRIKDADSPVRKNFTGIDTFPAHQRWRVEGRWEAYAIPRDVEIPNILGQIEKAKAPGRVHFRLDGQEYSLEPTQESPEDPLFFVFKDQTAGHETYGAGRFLYSDPPKDGKVMLDFNRAYNPPCCFTNYATCPLPTKENMLDVRIEAGEKTWGSGHAS
ncbi:MAG: DUF1684 domain-containing protein [Acidobacteriota bacterium]